MNSGVQPVSVVSSTATPNASNVRTQDWCPSPLAKNSGVIPLPKDLPPPSSSSIIPGNSHRASSLMTGEGACAPHRHRIWTHGSWPHAAATSSAWPPEASEERSCTAASSPFCAAVQRAVVNKALSRSSSLVVLATIASLRNARRSRRRAPLFANLIQSVPPFTERQSPIASAWVALQTAEDAFRGGPASL